jgi:hypothetical protein
MVKTRKTTASIQTRNQRTSLNRKSKRKRDQDSESDYVEPPSARKRRKSGTPQRSSRSQAQAENPGQDSQETEKESSEDSDKQEDTVLKGGWYRVRKVLDERYKEGSDGETKHEYLVDWAPSHQKTYQPTWELVRCSVALLK